MRLLIYIIILFSIVSCKETRKGNGVMTPRYIEDKASISKSMIDNIESYRISYIHDNPKWVGNEIEVPDEQKDMIGYHHNRANSNLFWYTRRLKHEGDAGKGMPSPKDMRTQLNVTTDTIFYDADSLLCIAFVVIEKDYDEIPDYERERHGFDGIGVIGVRDSINGRFKVYPWNNVQFSDEMSGRSYKSVVSKLQKEFFREIKDKTGYGLNNEEVQYKYGVDDPRFFETAPDFIQHDNGLYYFQTWYYRLGYDSIGEYKYYSNSPEYLKKDWKN